MDLVSPSTLSLATEGVRKAIDEYFESNVTVIVDIPQRAEQMIKDETPLINLFFYRILPSGFHAGSGSKDPLMLRLHCLITPFSKDSHDKVSAEDLNTTDPAGEINLRILGKVIGFFHQHPIIGPLPGEDQNSDGTRYTLESILRAPDMDEINHVWMTQGTDVPYRTSAAYEFSLIPIDPTAFPDSDTLITDYGGELRPKMDNKGDDFDETSGETFLNKFEIHFVETGVRTDSINFGGTAEEFTQLPDESVRIAVAGQKGKTVHLFWTIDEETEDGGEVEIKTENIESPLSEFFPKIPTKISTSNKITLRAEYLGQNSKPAEGVLPENFLTVNFVDQPQ